MDRGEIVTNPGTSLARDSSPGPGLPWITVGRNAETLVTNANPRGHAGAHGGLRETSVLWNNQYAALNEDDGSG